ncbi:hypothetical protein K9L97_03610 [Candidatus Woesearchaeota archaeon]|nr:hypothetical protein [Candidatus Woesearchaeota archaeon]
MPLKESLLEEQTRESVENEIKRLKNKQNFKTGARVFLAILATYAFFTRNSNISDLETIESLIDSTNVKAFKRMGLSISGPERSNFLFETFVDQNYLDTFLIKQKKFNLNLRSLLDQQDLNELATKLDDGVNSTLNTMLRSAVMDSSRLNKTYQEARFEKTSEAISKILENFSSKEYELFEISSPSQKSLLMKRSGSNLPIKDMRDITKIRKNYVLSLMPTGIFKPEELDNYIIMALWETETKSDETAIGRANNLDTGIGQFQPRPALNLVAKFSSRGTEYENIILRLLNQSNGTHYQNLIKKSIYEDKNYGDISLKSFANRIEKNLDKIKKLNKIDLDIRTLTIVRNRNTDLMSEIIPEDNRASILDRGLSDKYSIFSKNEYAYFVSLLKQKEDLKTKVENVEYNLEHSAQNFSDIKNEISSAKSQLELTNKKIKDIILKNEENYLQKSGEIKTQIDELTKNIVQDSTLTDVINEYYVLFDEKLQSILAAEYLYEVFENKAGFWNYVKQDSKLSGRSLEETTLFYTYISWMGGLGMVDDAFNAFKSVNFKKTEVEKRLKDKVYDKWYTLSRANKLVRNYDVMQKYKEQGVFEISPRNGNFEFNVLKDVVDKTKRVNLRDMIKNYIGY